MKLMDFAPEDVLRTVLPKSWVMDYIFWQKTGLLQKSPLAALDCGALVGGGSPHINPPPHLESAIVLFKTCYAAPPQGRHASISCFICCCSSSSAFGVQQSMTTSRLGPQIEGNSGFWQNFAQISALCGNAHFEELITMLSWRLGRQKLNMKKSSN